MWDDGGDDDDDDDDDDDISAEQSIGRGELSGRLIGPFCILHIKQFLFKYFSNVTIFAKSCLKLS